jgi:hypothetical protein
MRMPPYTIKSASLVAFVFAVGVTALHVGELALGFGHPTAYQLEPAYQPPATAPAEREPGDTGQN